MSSLTNAAPKVLFDGINDQSRGTLVRGEVTYAQHTPLLRLFCETGPETTTPIGPEGGDFNSLFGSQTLSRRSKYFNLQSLLAEKLLQEGNPFFVKRLRPEDAPNPARIILALEIVKDVIPRTTSALSGFNYPNLVDDTSVSALAAGETINGLRARIVAINDNQSEIGTQRVLPGTMLAESDGTQSMVYPLTELPAAFFGTPGNRLGMRVWAPTTEDAGGFDEATANEFMTRMFRFQFLKRSATSSSATVIKTVLGEDYVDCCFTPGAYSESTDKEYYIGQVLTQAYEDDGIESGQSPVYSPFSQIYVYEENIAEVQKLIYENEIAVNPAIATYLAGPGQVDFLTCTSTDGDKYQGIVLEGALKGGILLGKDTVVYAQGGGDGTMNYQTYEQLVTLENENFGELADDYSNLAVYAFSVIYDTGLSMEGKFAMMNVLAKRQDLQCRFTTYVESEQRAPTKSEELSRAQALMTRLKAYPESMLLGTAVCRAEIIQQTGQLVGGGYSKPVPQLIDYAVRWAKFAGQGNGVLREGKDIDVHPNNRVTEVKNLNVKFMNDALQSASWSSGATYSLSYDHRSQYYPCIRSVHNDDTSVLLSPLTVSIACDVMRLIRRVHAHFSGNAKLTDEQFIERSDKLILDLTNGRYGDRVNIIPETYFTADDKSNGFSWHCRVRIQASNPRTVMYFDLVTERRDTGAAS